MIDLLQIGAFSDAQQAIIDQRFRCHSLETVLADETLRTAVAGLITRSSCIVDPALLPRLPALRVISTFGVGHDGIPLAAAHARGIVVTNTPGVLDAAVSELGVGLALALLRALPQADRFVRAGQWKSGAFPLAAGLSGKAVGIVGLGRIGQGVAARLEPFGARLFYSGTRRPALSYQYVDGVVALAAAVDVLFVTCRGGPETENLIDADVLAALGTDGYLVNLSRGSVVDEPALLRALQTGGIRGAALDVYRREPDIDPAFFTLPNTVLTPHVGSATHETRAAMLQLTLDNLAAVLDGRPALTPVMPVTV
jgi:lactate dehydrogenase-like 2-hydroxyacid dehydrogenase